MASVFAARQEGPLGVGRLVAIKVMSAALSTDAAFRELFLREAAIATRLEHPNIVRVYEVGESGGDIYLVMEFVHGASVAALFSAARGPVPAAVALRIAADAARGLHAAHELCDVHGAPLRLVHQDISPQNLLVGYDGVTRLLDFGVARIGALEASRTDSVRGKPSYLAPEQLDGGRIDRRTDVFALGVVLYELLTGRRLFQRSTIAECHAAILRGSIPDVREERPDLPAEAAAIVAQALRRAPAERFATAAEMRRALADATTLPGLSVADESVIGDWVRGTVPPAISPAELERAIVESAGERRTDTVDVAELPTEPPRRRPDAGPRADASPAPEIAAGEPVRTPRSGRAIVAAILGGSFVIAMSAAFLLMSDFWGALAAPVGPKTPGVAGSLSLPAPPTTPPAAPPHEPQAAPTPEPITRGGAEFPTPTHATSSTSARDAAAPAYLWVRSNLYARVHVDGLDVGDSPTPSIRLKAGTHTISVTTRHGEQKKSRIVELRSGEERREFFIFNVSIPTTSKPLTTRQDG